MRRVVVTGLGMVTPLGGSVQGTWSRLIESKSGIHKIEHFDTSDLPCKIGGMLPKNLDHPDPFKADLFMPPKDQRKVDDFIIFGVAAAIQAIENSGWQPQNDIQAERTGVMIGSGIGGLPRIQETSIAMFQGGFKKVSPFFIPASLINLISGHISIKYGFKGPNQACVTACSTGAHAIGDAARLIQCNDADVMIAGGAEASVCRVALAGFAAMRALSSNFNEYPEQASRPWDEKRDGFVMGEGAGVVVLEEYEHAKKRGAPIYAELTGYGLSGDAYHISAPAPDGSGGYRAMRMALAKSGLNAQDIGYVNAHGTSTPMGDEIEIMAIKKLFDHQYDHLAVSSTKSSIGHLLGAAGGVEAIFSILALMHKTLPPTLNLESPTAACEGVNMVAKAAQNKTLRHVLSNSFGFGGTNASLIFSQI